MFEGHRDHYARLGELLDCIRLERTVVSGLSAGCIRCRPAPPNMPQHWTGCTGALTTDLQS
jgi:hypothetical protein